MGAPIYISIRGEGCIAEEYLLRPPVLPWYVCVPRPGVHSCTIQYARTLWCTAYRYQTQR
eukprot:6387999-Prymnesium_polylepis.1